MPRAGHSCSNKPVPIPSRTIFEPVARNTSASGSQLPTGRSQSKFSTAGALAEGLQEVDSNVAVFDVLRTDSSEAEGVAIAQQRQKRYGK